MIRFGFYLNLLGRSGCESLGRAQLVDGLGWFKKSATLDVRMLVFIANAKKKK